MGMSQRTYVGPILQVKSTPEFDVRDILEQDWFETLFESSNINYTSEWYYFTLRGDINDRDPWYEENDIRSPHALKQIEDMNYFYDKSSKAYKIFLQNLGVENVKIYYGVITEYS